MLRWRHGCATCLHNTARVLPLTTDSGAGEQKRKLITYEFIDANTQWYRTRYFNQRQRAMKLKENEDGKVYRDQAKLFGHVEKMEQALTESAFLPAERMPPQLLPKPVAELQLEGAAADWAPPPALLPQTGGVLSVSNEEAATNAELLVSQLKSEREQILEDLSSSDVGSSSSGTTWEATGLDPAVAHLARLRLGAKPTRVQARLLTALVNPDHNDVIFNSVTGSGKTAALVLAALNGVRTEGAGFNIVISRTRDVAYATKSLAESIVAPLGGQLVDGAKDDLSWMVLCEGKDEFEQHYRQLQSIQRTSAIGPRLLFTTADVVCELMFQKKMEFRQFGFLRRCYIDDAGQQFQVIRPGVHSTEMAAVMQDNPTAADLLAATLHQLPGPDVRSLMQLAAVSADMDTTMKDHIKAVCVKPERHAVILNPVRLPSNLHCLFSFYQIRNRSVGTASSATTSADLDGYLVSLMRNANSTIPGRAVIFVASEVNLLVARAALRKLGMDAKVLCEVFSAGTWQSTGWKFLILHEHEAFGHDIPLLSHVFITFPPRDRNSYLHMAGRAGRLGAPGWVYVVTDQRDAPAVAAVAQELDVDVERHCVTEDLRTVPSDEARSWTKALGFGMMDPRHIVEKNYDHLERASVDTSQREYFDRPAARSFWKEPTQDPVVATRKYERAMQIRNLAQKDPRVLEALAEDGMVDQRLRPTAKFHKILSMEGKMPKRL
jgi:superfamily II DNA/RNA helicase